MATERQIEANRQNAALSTGPRSAEGKAASRRNALRHGLAGDGVVVAEHEATEIARRLEGWSETLRPANELEEFQVLQAVTESVRVQRCQADERALLSLHAERAGDADDWHEAGVLEAEEAGARLSRDPSRTARRLRQTAQGCDWLLLRWEGLGRALDAGAPWDDAQRSLALDLLGVPRELRTGGTAADPGPGEGAAAAAPQRALVAAEVESLRRWRGGVPAARDLQAREAARLGVVTDEGPAARGLARLRRYESACRRRLDQALRGLLSARRAEAPATTRAAAKKPPATSGPTPAPATPPPPPLPPPAPIRIPPAPVAPPAPPMPTTLAPEPPRGNRRWRKAQARRARQSAA